MNWIEWLNAGGAALAEPARRMILYSGLMVLLLGGLDLFLARWSRARFRYLLWMLLLLRLVIPPSFAFPTGWVHWLSETKKAPEVSTVDLPPAGSSSPALITTISPGVAPNLTLNFHGVLAVIWMVGSAIALVFLFRRWVLTRRLVGRAAAAAPHLHDRLRWAADQFNYQGRLNLAVVTEPVSPFVTGLFRPVIVLPQTLVEALSPEQLTAVFGHEICHLKRGDLLIQFFQSIAQSLFWFHPLHWLGHWRIRLLREQSVDEWAMSQADLRPGYPETLLAVAKYCRRASFLSPPASIWRGKAQLSQRLQRLLKMEEAIPPRLGASRWAVLLLLALLLLPMGRAQNKPPRPEASKSATPELGMPLLGPDGNLFAVTMDVYQLTDAIRDSLLRAGIESGSSLKMDQFNLSVQKLLPAEKIGQTRLDFTRTTSKRETYFVPGQSRALQCLLCGSGISQAWLNDLQLDHPPAGEKVIGTNELVTAEAEFEDGNVVIAFGKNVLLTMAMETTSPSKKERKLAPPGNLFFRLDLEALRTKFPNEFADTNRLTLYLRLKKELGLVDGYPNFFNISRIEQEAWVIIAAPIKELERVNQYFTKHRLKAPPRRPRSKLIADQP